MDTDTDDNPTDWPNFACPNEKGEVSDQNQDTATADLDQTLLEQTYQETVRGIRSFMGWWHIPDIES